MEGMEELTHNTSVVFTIRYEQSTLINITRNMSTTDHIRYGYSLLLLLAVFTVIGNCLIVIAICRFKELRTVTNYMILSLAIADLLIGLVVMPLNISNEVLLYWPYGQNMCDLWHSFDVLASTASILNLCIIALDRYWAITDPIAYPRLMSKRRGVLCISVVWICSAIISFPSILWWRSVDTVVSNRCYFTQDTLYLLLSSMVSFYIPVAIMVAVYIKIFLVIKNQSRQHSETLRIHRGCGTFNKADAESALTQPLCNDIELTAVTSSPDIQGNGRSYVNGNCHLKSKKLSEESEPTHLKHLIQTRVSTSKKVDNSTSSNEYRVARTLGVVMGTFLVFWLPFFVCNLVSAVCKDCITNEVLFAVFTWLGHVNSGVNPVIYACSMDNMRHAFISILSCQYRHYYNYKKNRCRKLAVPPKKFQT